MKSLLHPSVGLVGRILAILLLTIVVEFFASTILYDQASSLRGREDEAHRLAEHLAVASRIIVERPLSERPEAAAGLSTKNFVVRWTAMLPKQLPMSADLAEMRQQIASWESTLDHHNLRIYMQTPDSADMVMGSVKLEDGSWLLFRAPQIASEQKFRIAWIIRMLAVAVALSLIAGLLVRQTLLPLRTLSKAAETIGQGEQNPLPDMGSGEIRRLVRAFNEMQARIHSFIADQVEALAAVGHDLRTPLARLLLRAETIPDGALRDSMADDIIEMERMVASLLAYLGGDDDPEEPTRIDLASMISTLVNDVIDAGGSASFIGPDHLEHMVRRGSFKRALRNVVENAAKYGTNVRVTLKKQESVINVTVEDDGPGMPEDRLTDVLKPFVRLDSARGRDTKGLGLGLAIATRAIHREGGTLELSNRSEGGLRASINLPLALAKQ